MAAGSAAQAVTLAALEADPHPVLARLRAAAPVSWVPVLGAWLVTGYDEAVQVMRDARRFTVDDPRFSTAKVVGPSMLSLDGARHAHHRGPFTRPFRSDEIRARLASFIQGPGRPLPPGPRPTGPPPPSSPAVTPNSAVRSPGPWPPRSWPRPSAQARPIRPGACAGTPESWPPCRLKPRRAKADQPPGQRDGPRSPIWPVACTRSSRRGRPPRCWPRGPGPATG